MKRLIVGMLCLGICFGCSKKVSETDEKDRKISVVCTTGMVGDIVKNIMGNTAEVSNMIKAGTDPHLYSPTRGDVAALITADLVFYSGLYLEGRMEDVFKKIEEKGKTVFAVTDNVPKEYLLMPADYKGHPDPHVWMDVQGWIHGVNASLDLLVGKFPEHAEAYNANANAYIEKLTKLDAYIKKSMASIPENQRVLVTAHDAFSYFGRAYGLTERGIQGISTDSEAGLKDISNLVSFLVENKIPAVFVESTIDPKNVQALIEGAKARGHNVVIGGELFADAMGSEGTYEGTFVGMLDHNATTIARALGGTAEEKGFQGKLSVGRHE